TLETALFKVPQVVAYKGNEISYQIAKRVIKLDYISLVNLIMDEQVVTELIQKECDANTIQKEFEKIIDTKNRVNIFAKYDELEERLGGVGASKRVVIKIRENLSKI